jgi:hypothetical protein
MLPARINLRISSEVSRASAVRVELRAGVGPITVETGGRDRKWTFLAWGGAACALLALLAPASPAATKADGPDRNSWTIGVLVGPSPFALATPPGIVNPVLTGADVTDLPVDTIAHPFMVVEAGRYHLFFTAKDARTDTGGIALAESADGFRWKFRKTVVREAYVLSHPCVFQWQGDHYLVPEAHTLTSVRLYKATRFPEDWQFECSLLEGGKFISPTLVHYRDLWWMFVSPPGNQTLRLYFSPGLKGTWREHPLSPIVANEAHSARPGGRPLLLEGKLYRLAQDCLPTYGAQVRAFEILEMSPTEYREKLVDPPLIRKDPEGGWNRAAMHHVDAHRLADGRWLAAVDALGRAAK